MHQTFNYIRYAVLTTSQVHRHTSCTVQPAVEFSAPPNNHLSFIPSSKKLKTLKNSKSMGDFKGHLAVILCILLAIDGERWYSATFHDSEPQKIIYFGPSKADYKTSYVPDNNLKYLPISMIKNGNQTKKDKFSTKERNDVTTSVPPLKIHNEKLTKFPFLYKHLNKTLFRYEEPVIEKFTHDDAMSTKSSNSSNHRRIFEINKTITNLNVIRKPKPKPHAKLKRNKIQRCSPIRQRQKKQLGSKQNIQKRFLEVFEVVEFDHVPCISSSGLEGTCLPEFDCHQSSGSSPMGTCADGYGTCCVTQFSCDGYSSAPSFWFVNPEFPLPSTERLSCVLTLHKASTDIQQIRLDFNNFELLAPTAGSCEQDQFMITGQNVNNVIPILCGVNTGQHVYIEVGVVDGPITFSVQTVSSDSRLFSIKVTQLNSVDELSAPTGCLQYFRGPQGFLESFNYRDKSDIAIARSPSYLNNLNYAICIERATEACSMTYTNTGNMQIVNYDSDGLPVIPPMQAGVEIFNCPTDWLLIAAVRLCGDRLNDGSVLQDFALDAPVTDIGAGPIVVWFRSDGAYVGRGFRLQYQQNHC